MNNSLLVAEECGEMMAQHADLTQPAEGNKAGQSPGQGIVFLRGFFKDSLPKIPPQEKLA